MIIYDHFNFPPSQTSNFDMLDLDKCDLDTTTLVSQEH